MCRKKVGTVSTRANAPRRLLGLVLVVFWVALGWRARVSWEHLDRRHTRLQGLEWADRRSVASTYRVLPLSTLEEWQKSGRTAAEQTYALSALAPDGRLVVAAMAATLRWTQEAALLRLGRSTAPLRASTRTSLRASLASGAAGAPRPLPSSQGDLPGDRAWTWFRRYLAIRAAVYGVGGLFSHFALEGDGLGVDARRRDAQADRNSSWRESHGRWRQNRGRITAEFCRYSVTTLLSSVIAPLSSECFGARRSPLLLGAFVMRTSATTRLVPTFITPHGNLTVVGKGHPASKASFPSLARRRRKCYRVQHRR